MNIKEELFEWIYQSIDGKGYSDLLQMLYDIPFYTIIPLDDNRLIDGCDMRFRFADECDIPTVVLNKVFNNRECSVLEMMVGLSIRIEDTIMSDSDFGDRTSMWFWIMIKSLGLYNMTNDRIDIDYVINTVDTFLNRGYRPNGEGGLFTVNNTSKDMRDVEIWYQMCMYFDNLL